MPTQACIFVVIISHERHFCYRPPHGCAQLVRRSTPRELARYLAHLQSTNGKVAQSISMLTEGELTERLMVDGYGYAATDRLNSDELATLVTTHGKLVPVA